MPTTGGGPASTFTAAPAPLSCAGAAACFLLQPAATANTKHEDHHEQTHVTMGSLYRDRRRGSRPAPIGRGADHFYFL